MMPLIGPISRLFGAPDPAQGPVPPEIFDDAVGHPHPWVSAIARILRAHAALNLGRQHAQAEADFLAAAGILATIGERWGQAVALGGLAMLEGWRGEHAAAVGHYRQAREFAAAFGSTEDEVLFRLFMVRELWLLGEREAARAELARAQARRRAARPARGRRLRRLHRRRPGPPGRRARGRPRSPGPGHRAGQPAERGPADSRRGRHRARLPGRRRRRPGRGPRLARPGAGRRPVLGRRAGDRRGPDRAGRSGAARSRPGARRRADRSERGDPGYRGPFGHR